jgi:hypothetical protein
VGLLVLQPNVDTDYKNVAKKTAAQLTTNKAIVNLLKEAKNPVLRQFMQIADKYVFSLLSCLTDHRYYSKIATKSAKNIDMPTSIKEKEQQLLAKERQLLEREQEIRRTQGELQMMDETVKKKQKEEAERRDSLKKKQEKFVLLEEEVRKKIEIQGGNLWNQRRDSIGDCIDNTIEADDRRLL